MTIQRLRGELDEVYDALQVLRNAGENPFGKGVAQMNFRVDDWHRNQKKSIRVVAGAVKDAFRDAQRIRSECGDKLILLLTGSVARLEFMPNDSDFDFLAVWFGDVPDGDNWHKVFSVFEKRLTRHLEARQTILPGVKLAVEVNGVPSPKGKVFYTEDDLFGPVVGKEHETSWAVIERYCLLFESVCCRGARRSMLTALNKKADECYRLSDDIQRGLFPALCSSLVYAMMFSGVMAKLAHVRKTATMSDADKIIVKTVFSRIWGAAANLIMLHLLYWRRLFGDGEGITDEQIRLCSRRSTIYKIIEIIPTQISFLRERPGQWYNVHSGSPDAAKSAIENLEEMNNFHQEFETEEELTLLGCYLDLLMLVEDVRRGDRVLTQETMKRIHSADERLRRLVGLVEQQTWEIIRSRKSHHANGYSQLIELIGRHLFRSVSIDHPEKN